ncbi:MAG: thioredoxin family protein [Pirellulales bacterium]
MPPPRIVTAAIVLALAAAHGCSVRDEQTVGGGEARWWSTATGGANTGLIAGAPPAQRPAATIEYVEGFAAAAKRAGDAGLPMLVVFRADWCRWSGELVSAAVADPRVVDLARRFVCVAVDADRDAATCREFAVDAFPTVMLLDASRGVRFRATGTSAAARLASAMAEVLSTRGRAGRVAGGTATPVR